MEQSNQTEQQTEDEFGPLNVFSEKRVECLKNSAQNLFSEIQETIKKSEQIVNSAIQCVLEVDTNVKSFVENSKEYAKILKLIEEEGFKPRF